MILAIDTATRNISLALASEGAIVAEATWHTQNNHTVELAPALERMLTAQNVSAKDLTAVAVAIGPGSFTGVRIGLGLAKGLALANNLPLIGVPTLDVLARALPGENLIAAIQAGRRRVIWAKYENGRAASPTVLGTWDDVAIHASGGETVVGEIDPDGLEVLSRHQIKIGSLSQNVRRAACLAEIAWERWHDGATDDAAILAPIYAHQPASGG
ncbi:MAG: tRNA (adenosine(37)-N6)-threonylcarbamoyltransferase complex dimerization subunit type 1 TsaB [Chloroflexi bacterium]|nr:tRNA (adenosine(37)-N6)-threonylcarbamoyltransferase complex dimerization subunit type 1 TsaB [Chloroflexota bacterium]